MAKELRSQGRSLSEIANVLGVSKQTFSSNEMRGRAMSLFMIANETGPLDVMLTGALAVAVSRAEAGIRATGTSAPRQ